MWEILKKWDSHNVMDFSWEVQELRFSYKDIILPWLLGLNTSNPGNLVDELTEYRKIH